MIQLRTRRRVQDQTRQGRTVYDQSPWPGKAALNGILADLDEDADDGRIIRSLLPLIDEISTRLGEVYRAVIVARK